jgi:integrase
MDLLKEIYKKKYTVDILRDKVNVSPIELHRKIIDEICDFKSLKELKSNLRYISKTYKRLYPNKGVLSRKFSEIRKPIRVKYGKYDENGQITPEYKCSLELMHISRVEGERLKKKYIRSIKRKNMKQRTFSKSELRNMMYDLLIGDTDKYDITISLLLGSGMRPVELLHLSTVEVIDTKTIKVSNLAKKRDGEESVSIRPILCKAQDFVSNFLYVRSLFKNCMKDGFLKSTITSTISRRLKKYLNREDVSCYDLRSLYAVICYDNLPNKQTVNFNIYISSILGHADSNILSSFAYSAISLTD